MAPFIVILQAPLPEHAPLQPVKMYPLDAEAESVTEVPCANVAEQDPGQETPAGELVTAPLPLTVTVRVSSCTNVAVTLLPAVIVTVQVLVPEQAPDQPEKLSPADGVAVSVTIVPYENVVEQVPGQEMPAGELVTVPLPLTLTESVSGSAVNVAVTLVELNSVTWQAPVPEQAPDQPVKLCPAEGEAVRLTVVP